jgi:tetratricopeptide (TPR) repeat protein
MTMTHHLSGRIAGLLLLAAAALPAQANVPPAAQLPPGAQQQLDQARQARQRGDLPVATLLLKNAAQAAPRSSAIQAELGTLLVMQGQSAQAERTLRQALKLGAPQDLVRPALFQAMLSQRKYQALLDEFPEPSAGGSDTLRARALAFFGLGKAAEADAAIDKALALKRTAPLLVNKAEFALSRGDRGAAERLTDEALKLAPRESTALIMKIGLLERQGAYGGAIGFADQLVKASPGQVLPLVLRIELLAKLQRYRDAEADTNRLLAIAPNLPIGLYDRALLLAQKGDIKGAWQIAQALPPTFIHSDPQFGIGFAKIAQAAGNTELSLAALTAAVAAFPRNEEARRALAQKQLDRRDFAGLVATMQPLQSGTNPGDMVLLAKAYSGLGQNQRARDFYARAGGGGATAGIDQLLQAAIADPANAETAGTLVPLLVGQGRTEEAVQAVDRFEKAAPRNVMVGFLRAEIAMAEGDLDRAAAGFNGFLQTQPNSTPALYYLAQIEAGRGDFAKAQSRLDQVLKSDPRNIQALSKKAQYALQLGKADEAAALLQKTVALSGDALEPKLALGEIYLSQGKFQQAQSVAALAVKRFPNDMRAVTQLTRAYLGMKAPDRARAAATALVKARPNSAAAQLLLASVLEQAGDRNGATAATNAAVRAEPGNAEANRFLAMRLLRAGQNERAVTAARDAARKLPQPAGDLFVADMMARTGDKKGATSLLERSFARTPNSRTLLAIATLKADSDRKAMESRIATWLNSHPRDVTLRSQLATLLMADGNLAQAKVELEKALAIQPYNASLLNDLAWAVQKTDGARAVRLASQAARISPRSGEILDTLAWIKWQQNDRKGGLELLQQAHRLSPDQPSIAYHLAVALSETGDHASARNVLQVALKPGGDQSNREQALKLEASWRSQSR